MHADEVGLGNGVGLGACRQLREVGFDEADIVEARGAGETGADGDMGGIVVDRRDLPAGVGRRRDEGADAEATAQFEVAGGSSGSGTSGATLPNRQASAMRAGDCWT